MSKPNGQLLDLKHTSQIRLGDQIYVTFGFTNAGYWKFGSEETFTVVQKTKDAKIRMKAEDGSLIPEPQNPPIGGTREHMLAELRKLSSFKEVKIIRPFAESPVRTEEEVEMEPAPRKAPGHQPITPGAEVIVGLGLYGLALYMAQNEDEEEED